jgi:hypothetical protein
VPQPRLSCSNKIMPNIRIENLLKKMKNHI